MPLDLNILWPSLTYWTRFPGWSHFPKFDTFNNRRSCRVNLRLLLQFSLRMQLRIEGTWMTNDMILTLHAESCPRLLQWMQYTLRWLKIAVLNAVSVQGVCLSIRQQRRALCLWLRWLRHALPQDSVHFTHLFLTNLLAIRVTAAHRGENCWS